MIIELKHLKTLIVLRASNTLVEAADQLCVTQSALSHQLKDLEERLNTPLFIRKSRPIQFTEAGKRLLALADECLPRIQQVEREIHQLVQGDNGRLHMAIECHSCFNWLMPTVNIFRQSWPAIDLDFSSGFTFEPLAALSAEDIDIVVTSDPQALPGIHYEPLFRYEILMALAIDHPLAHKANITPQDLRNETLITYPVEPSRLDIYSKFLLPAGVTPKQQRTTELTLMMLQLVMSDRGLCALPNWVLSEYSHAGHFCVKPLGAGLWSTLYLAYRLEQADCAYLNDFIEQAKRHCFEQLHGVKKITSLHTTE